MRTKGAPKGAKNVVTAACAVGKEQCAAIAAECSVTTAGLGVITEVCAVGRKQCAAVTADCSVPTAKPAVPTPEAALLTEVADFLV